MVAKKDGEIFREYRYFVFSSCKSSDSLPMWNYYTKNWKNYGYNISIDLETLDIPETFIKHESQVYYKNADKIKIIQSILDKYYKKYAAAAKNFEDDGRYKAIRDCVIELEAIRLFFKNECFAHEEEYKVIVAVPIKELKESKEARFIFTPQNGVLRPQVEIKFKSHNEFDEVIKSITISKFIDFELAKKGLKYFLLKENIKADKIRISCSKLPIRF